MSQVSTLTSLKAIILSLLDKVPYLGADRDVDLGTKALTAAQVKAGTYLDVPYIIAASGVPQLSQGE